VPPQREASSIDYHDDILLGEQHRIIPVGPSSSSMPQMRDPEVMKLHVVFLELVSDRVFMV
jgi:hypothetical protein